MLIYFLYQKIVKRDDPAMELPGDKDPRIQKFIELKKAIAALLVPILVGLAVYTFFNWASAVISDQKNGIVAFANINKIFFDEFFTILIIVDVLLLLASFFTRISSIK